MSRMSEVEREIRWFYEDTEVGPQYVVTFGESLDTAVVWNRHNGEILKRGALDWETEKWNVSQSIGNIRAETRIDGISYRRVGGELIWQEEL